MNKKKFERNFTNVLEIFLYECTNMYITIPCKYRLNVLSSYLAKKNYSLKKKVFAIIF